MANLFTSQTPSVTDASDGTPGITTGTTVVFAVDGTVTGIRFYATTTTGGTYTGALWTVDSSDPGGGTLQRQATLGTAPTGGTWNTVTLDPPVTVTAGLPYRASLFNSDGRYVATVGFFSSAGLTNGSISAPQHNTAVGAITVSQGTFRINAAAGYPNTSGNGTCYFVDVEFTASTGETGSGTLTLPALTASGTGTASASGAGTLTLPALTASGAGTASATGTAALTLPALTASGAGISRASGSGSLTLPALTVSGFGGEPADEVSAPGPVIRTTARDRTLRTSTRGG